MTRLPDLTAISASVEDAGRAVAAEFTRPGGPRGRGDHADIDDTIARDLQRSLMDLFPARWVCEETETLPGSIDGYCWLIDPHDGTTAYLDGHRDTAISVALLHRGEPVLGVVHAPLPPDRGPDTIAWAHGMERILRNGRLLPAMAAERRLDTGAIVFVSHAAAGKPLQNGELVAPGRFVALPSIAYRLARAACGDGVAAVSLNGPCGWDYAGGHALLRGAGGLLLDQTGEEVRYTEHGASRVSFCFGGAPEAAAALVRRNWNEVFRGKSLPGFGLPPTPRMAADLPLDRATGCLFGLIAGDSLGGQVEFATPQAIARKHPQGVRNLVDGGVWNILAGQPTDDGELALSLAWALVASEAWDEEAVATAYGAWATSEPFDMGHTTRQALYAAAAAQTGKAAAARRAASRDSQANGSLMRIAPIGLWARDAEEAAAAAAADSRLSHPHPSCVATCAAFAAAIHVAIVGGDRTAMQEAAEAAAVADAPVLAVLREARQGVGLTDALSSSGWVLHALRNAFHRLWHAPDLEIALIETVGLGGDTDTNAAICGALLGAAHGVEAVPVRWRMPILACRPIEELGARHPRPRIYWPVDLPDIAEQLLARAAGVRSA